MSATSERTTTRPIITRHFESSRHQFRNLAAAFENALPVIRRGPAQAPAPHRSTAAPCTRRRIES